MIHLDTKIMTAFPSTAWRHHPERSKRGRCLGDLDAVFTSETCTDVLNVDELPGSNDPGGESV
jgi:hypothetical protein